jgi:hypothetical protein
MGDLTSTQRLMLTGPFSIDGWRNTRWLPEAQDLVQRGLLTCTEGGDDQYTVLRFYPATPPGDRP